MKKFYLLFVCLFSLIGYSQTVVNLVRQSDGAIIGTATLDDNFCTQSDTTTTETDTTTTENGLCLYFEGVPNQCILVDYSFSGPFDFSVKTQGVLDVGGWIGLAGINSANRFLLSNSNQRFWANIGSGTLSKRNTLIFDSGLILETRIYRDNSNDIYIQFNGQTPFYCFSSSNTFTASTLFRAYDKYFKGYVMEYTINGELFDLSEQGGDILTGSNGTVHHIQTNVSLDSMWKNAPIQQASAQVINEGVGGDDVDDLLARTDIISAHEPELIFVWVGTNDALNEIGNQIKPVEQYQDSLDVLITNLKTQNPGAEIAILTVPPCIDSILKSNHDYSTHYGPNNSFDLNVDIIPTFNAAINTVATNQNIIVLDVFNLVLQNLGWLTDGTHLSAAGYAEIAELCKAVAIGKNTIVCFGDSLTKGANVSGGFDYPTQLEQLINQ